ncbi:DUF4175 family protein [Dyadobacter sp. Leaf189]|uniref:DUF4175 family protein n=1 Tax=Dyadobacter sp. Leaf189 TaxID=1736295 RepID=UPI0006F5911B|nr:DUF4175 family protein [Dyadobacter sp. Leaf189]KQS23764.1 ATPase [Dyadobacter sp. Leaf189]
MEGLLLRIQEYRQKYYQNQLLKGIIFSLGLLLTVFLFFNTIEYFGRFSSVVRGMLFFGFLAVLVFSVFQWVVQPLIHLSGLKKPISDEAAALQIGQYFPEIGDKLVNTLQLRSLSGSQSDLIEASIKQKSNQLLIVRFSDAIRFNENRKRVKYAIYPLAAIAVILLFNPAFFSSSSDRIIHFQKNYTYAPFSFVLENKNLKAFRNEDFTLKLKLEGEALPAAVYLVQNGSRFKLTSEGNRSFAYTFKNLQRDVTFSFDAAGFASDEYRIDVNERPSLLSFDVNLHYPAYLNKPSEGLSNVGNLSVPEGTTIEWYFNTASTNSLAIKFENDSALYQAKESSGEHFQIRKSVKRSAQYQVSLKNDETTNADKIGYFINVIPDKHPVLTLENFQDTTLYNYLVLGGSISDDYGFSQLKMFYTVNRSGQKEASQPKGIPIPFNKTVNTQSFFFQWYVDSLKLAPGDKIEYYAQVWDNDGINGAKSARSRSIQFTVPSKDQLEAEIKKSEQETENQIQSAMKKAQNLQKDIENLDNRLKSNKELDFKEQKQIEEVLRKREELMKELQALQEKHQNSNEKSRQFNQQSPELQNKIEQLQKLMNALMDENTDKLYKDLKKLLEQKQSERMSSLMEKLKNKENNLEKELERTMKLFKQMQLEQKMENLVDKLNDLAEKEDMLAEKTELNDKNKNQEDKAGKNEELKKEQEKIQEDFQKAQDNAKEIEKMGEELEKPVDTQKEEQKGAAEQMEEAKAQLARQQNKKASTAQKKAAESMKKMSQSMEESMEAAEMEQMQENMDDLRDILENLITLSFDQEALMKDFKGVSLQDPRFVKLGQQQLKLKDDAKIVEDSLYSLAGRAEQIQAFITRELNDMKSYMDESVKSIKDRQINSATSKQQSAMTSMNNLALMLSDVFNQMQQQMAMAMPGAGKGKKGKQKGNSPGMGEMQEKLNGQIKQLGEGKEGQGNSSEKLARMAAEQAAIRKMIQDLMESQKGSEVGKQMGKELQEIADKMDETETDLVNKRITPELIKRNQEITTRLLESEKAMKEQDEDEQRKAQSAKQQPRQPPAAFEKYIREKEKQTELLRTIPPTFSPFYKREVDTYFRKYQAKN